MHTGTTLADVALLRVVAQRLAGPQPATPAAAVAWMTCVQAQDLPGALTSVALRTAARSRADVLAALDAGEIVRSWPMRGTLHLTPAQDLPWLLRLLAPRMVRASAARRAGLGLSDPQFDQAGELTVAALAGGRALSRAELFGSWLRAGLDPGGQRGVHLLRYLAMTGLVVLGPTAGAEQLIVLLDEWISHPRDLAGDQALGELALRYFCGHGPAHATDLAGWAKLTAGETRTAVALARPSLAVLEVDGIEYLLDPRTPDLLAAARAEAEGVLLLPGFDELLLGHRDRRAQLDPVHADRIVPGGNGMFRPTVLQAGRVVGTWTRTRRAAGPELHATAFTEFSPEVTAALPGVFQALP